MNRNVRLGILLATLIALTLRCPNLSDRPMHNDEAVNALKLRPMMAQGNYHYDPNEHHGPTLNYFAWAWIKILAVKDFSALTETQLRVLVVVFGAGLILLLPLIADGLGRSATVWAGILTAISSAMVFYSRYFIHEMLLVFFTLLALAAFWRHYRTRKIFWAIVCGAAVGLMQSTKETFVLSVGAAVVALLLNKFWSHTGDFSGVKPRKLFKPLAAGLLAWGLVAAIFFSSFFTNRSGLLDSVRTYLPWIKRAAGHSPHIHPWYFYFSRLVWFHAPGGPVWSEGFILMLAVVGIFVALTGKLKTDSKLNFLRFLAFYTLTLTLIYNLIAYKTPWCLLNFWLGAILLAGVGAVAVWQLAKTRWAKMIVGLFLFAGTLQSAFQASQASGNYSADRRNPYVYAQTSTDVLELADKINGLARASAEKLHLRMDVCASGNDYWPLPWYLRTFDQVGWSEKFPNQPLPPVMIVSSEFAAELDEMKTYQAAGWFELRPGVFFALYVEPDLWRTYLNSKTTEKK